MDAIRAGKMGSIGMGKIGDWSHRRKNGPCWLGRALVLASVSKGLIV
jgi:hypothetical protein